MAYRFSRHRFAVDGEKRIQKTEHSFAVRERVMELDCQFACNGFRQDVDELFAQPPSVRQMRARVCPAKNPCRCEDSPDAEARVAPPLCSQAYR